MGRDTSVASCRKVGEAAGVLRGVLGKPGECGAEDEGIWSAVSAVICGSGRTWDVGVARAVVCWVADPQDSSVDEAGTRTNQPSSPHCLTCTIYSTRNTA